MIEIGKEELEELRAIKKLLVLHLIKSGANTQEIGSILGVTARRIRQIIPTREIQKYGGN